MKRKILFTILLSSVYFLQAQIMPLNNENLLNEFITNPALAGINKTTNISFLSRMQWLGLSEAPRSQCFSFDSRIKAKGRYNHSGKLIRKSRIPRTGRVGFGGFVFNDINKPFSKTGVNLAYAYHLQKANHNLSLGLGAAIYLLGHNNSEFIASDMNDPSLRSNENILLPNLNFGLFYKYKNFFLGASALHLLSQTIQFSDVKNEIEKSKNQIFVHSGIIFNEAKKTTLSPSIIYRSISNQFDANIKITRSKKYILSFSYHSTNSASVILGLKIKKLFLHYSYQFPTGSIINYNSGSQMMMINYEL